MHFLLREILLNAQHRNTVSIYVLKLFLKVLHTERATTNRVALYDVLALHCPVFQSCVQHEALF